MLDWREGLLPPEKEEKEDPLSDPQSLYQIVSLLQGAAERGTGRQARVPGHTVAGKTGTTNEVKDVWFIGFSKNLVAGVWMGYDAPRPMGPGAGSHMPARVFSDFMTVALADVKDQPFPVPSGIEFRRVNRQTGAPASGDEDGHVISEAFKRGQKPVAVNLDARGKKQESFVEIGGVF
jgi:penicillin-binding protein 1A